MQDTGSEAAPDWDALVAPIALTQPWRGDAERAEGSQILAGRGGASPGRARIRHLSGNLAARLNLRRGHDRRPSRRPPVPGLVRAEVWGALT